MTSLIAQFFRKNVALNMKATDEKTPQTVKDMAVYSPGKNEETNSLLAEFFRKTVTLNKGATVESSPQTAYVKPWYDYDRVWSMPSTYQEWERQYVSPKVDDYRMEGLNPILSESASFDTRYIGVRYPRCDVYLDDMIIVVEIALSEARKCGVTVDRRSVYTIGESQAIQTVFYRAVQMLDAKGMEVKDIKDMVEYEMQKFFNSR